MSASANVPMNPRLLAVLALVLAMAAWLQWQSADDTQGADADLLAAPEQRASRAPAATGSAPARDDRAGLAAAQHTLARYVSPAPATPRPQQAPSWLTAEPPPPPPPPR